MVAVSDVPAVLDFRDVRHVLRYGAGASTSTCLQFEVSEVSGVVDSGGIRRETGILTGELEVGLLLVLWSTTEDFYAGGDRPTTGGET